MAGFNTIIVLFLHFVLLISALPEALREEAPQECFHTTDVPASLIAKPMTYSTSTTAPLPTDAPLRTRAGLRPMYADGLANANFMTWNIVNLVPTPLSVLYRSNTDAGTPCPPPLGSPTNAPLPSSTQVVFPKGWGGNLVIGPMGSAEGSKIEGSFFNQQPHIDISYVDGYTVPMSCTCRNEADPVSGCNHDLHALNTCPDQREGFCFNPSKHKDNGPAAAFFRPCQGSAYTFPNDNIADKGCPNTNIVDCCIGANCPAPQRQLTHW